jgi:hypothetical protein
MMAAAAGQLLAAVQELTSSILRQITQKLSTASRVSISTHSPIADRNISMAIERNATFSK